MFGDARVVRRMASLGTRARWGGAVLVAVLAVALQMLQWRFDGGRAPFLVFCPFLVFAAAAFDRGPALLVFFTGLVAGAWMLEPDGSLPGWAGSDPAAVAAYSLLGLLSIYLGGLGRLYAWRALRAEQALADERVAQSEAQRDHLYHLLLQAPGFVVILRGPAHLIELTNTDFDALVGRGGLVGTPFAGAVPELASAHLVAQLDAAFRSGTSYAARETPVHVGTGASPADRLRYIDFALQPIGDNGRPTGVFLSGVDVSEARRAREALLLNEERLKEGLMAARMAVWEFDLPRNEVLFSDSAVFLFGASLDVLRQPWHLIHPDDLPRVLEARAAAIARRGDYQMIIRARRADDGSALWLDLRGRCIVGADGEVRKLRGVTLDVTAREVAEQGLRTAERRKDEFLAMLAHELRNPLAPISAAATLLQRGIAQPAQVAMAAAIVARQSAHLSRLVDDLLDAARISRGKVELVPRAFDLRDAVRDALEQVHPLLAARHHALEAALPSGPVGVDGDRARLTQVVANLLSNAIRFTPAGGRIGVELAIVDSGGGSGDGAGHAQLTVSDNGCGISADLLPHVFGLFTQGERGADRSQGGLGIGLAIVSGLVALHGGTVHAASDGPGRGARFTVTLPAIALPPPPAAAVAPAVAARSLDLLLVDDNRDAADTLAILLRGAGHRCDTRYDAESALAAVRAAQPDACILDIGLPGMDGYTLAREIRAIAGDRAGGRAGDPERRGIVLFALSGYGRAEDREQAAAAGFDRHFVKPVAPDELLGALAAASAASGAATASAAGGR
ncbi:hybrid sensor histidine kinase/response regulator [Pseudoduganella umbonata]|uniref:histidine kinase n=1 Tax=Pseudoduganella umbonata TaxID=864828 RepID=A0A4P8HMU4_9BURK|nr:ATP-binding protein [Pseudoduganella umbonata]MBB3221143.1 PAS domain S-box-containing protein [Pseudoduganella umbonata]QCP10336.1 response regulator [Pseudoduganella umbonata]